MKRSTLRGAAGVSALVMFTALGFSANAGAVSSVRDINEQPVSALKQGGTFTYAINSLPDNFNNSTIDGNTADTSYIMGPTQPGAFMIDENGKFAVDTNYVTKAVVSSKNPEIITYTLNPKAVWSDGKAVGLADWVGMWKANNGVDTTYDAVSTSGYEDISSVKAGGTNEIVVTFKKIFADWQGLFGGILPASMTATSAAYNKNWLTKPDVSAGPFKYSSMDTTAGTVTLVQNPTWWGDKPVLDKIIFRAVDPANQLDALKNGEVDYIDIGPSAPQYKLAKEMSGVTVHTAKAPNFRHVTFGQKDAPMKNVLVRQAIMLAMDRSVVAKALMGPIIPNVQTLDNHIFVGGVAGNQDNTSGLGKHNLAQAKGKLALAGYHGVPAKDASGKALTLSITIPSGVPTSASEAALIQSSLKEAGITLTINVVPLGDFFAKYINVGDFDLTVFTWIGTALPISSAVGIYKTDGPQNYGGIGSAAIDALLEKANSTLDQAKRVIYANQADALIWKIGHSVTNYQRPNNTVTKSTVANMGSFGFTSGDWTKVGFVK